MKLNMSNVFIQITDIYYIYGKYSVNEYFMEEIPEFSGNIKYKKIKLDCAFVHYFIKEINNCDLYRKGFVHYWGHSLKIILINTQYDLIDYKWNERVYLMVRERCELDHALSWLSTLGGAFSALGI